MILDIQIYCCRAHFYYCHWKFYIFIGSETGKKPIWNSMWNRSNSLSKYIDHISITRTHIFPLFIYTPTRSPFTLCPNLIGKKIIIIIIVIWWCHTHRILSFGRDIPFAFRLYAISVTLALNIHKCVVWSFDIYFIFSPIFFSTLIVGFLFSLWFFLCLRLFLAKKKFSGRFLSTTRELRSTKKVGVWFHCMKKK